SAWWVDCSYPGLPRHSLSARLADRLMRRSLPVRKTSGSWRGWSPASSSGSFLLPVTSSWCGTWSRLASVCPSRQSCRRPNDCAQPDGNRPVLRTLCGARRQLRTLLCDCATSRGREPSTRAVDLLRPARCHRDLHRGLDSFADRLEGPDRSEQY